MKRILIFTIFGPLIGIIPIYAILSSKGYDGDFMMHIRDFFLISEYSFQFGFVPALITGVISTKLDFNKISGIFLCVIVAVSMSSLFIWLWMRDDYLLLSFSVLASIFSASIICIFIKSKGY